MAASFYLNHLLFALLPQFLCSMWAVKSGVVILTEFFLSFDCFLSCYQLAFSIHPIFNGSSKGVSPNFNIHIFNLSILLLLLLNAIDACFPLHHLHVTKLVTPQLNMPKHR